MGIGKVLENKNPPRDIHSITSPHWGITFQTKDDHRRTVRESIPRYVSVKELIETVVKALVDKPEEVTVSEITGHRTIVYELKVAKKDMGRVIGKKGNNINAIRELLSALAEKQQKRVTLSLLEQ
jgi:hypothetical protein